MNIPFSPNSNFSGRPLRLHRPCCAYLLFALFESAKVIELRYATGKDKELIEIIMEPTSAEMAAFGSIGDVLDWAGDNSVVRFAFVECFGIEATAHIRVLAATNEAEYAQLLESITITVADREPRHLKFGEKATLRLVYQAVRLTLGLEFTAAQKEEQKAKEKRQRLNASRT